MICSSFRNSDDPTVYLFNIPENLFAVTSLRQLPEMADALMLGNGLAAECRALAGEVATGILQYGIVNDPKFGKMTPPPHIHDPSTIIRFKDEYWLFTTGMGLPSWRSRNLIDWSAGPPVFPIIPAWTTGISRR